MKFVHATRFIVPHYVLLAVAAGVLAYHPVLWLVQTWTDPSYDSKGFLVFLVCLGLFLWSITSDRVTCRPADYRKPFFFLGLSAAVRLIGQVLAVNVIGAATLLVDIYALSHLARLQDRARAVSPFWLAVCFGFSLPLERIVQRAGGYGLQHLSADGACLVLGSIFDKVTCHGVRILMGTKDVLVDLPCSGARSALLLLFFYACCAAVARLKADKALLGLVIALASALLANTLRICLLAVGIAFPLGGLDVMAQPAHDLIGLVTLGLGSLPILLWTGCYAHKQQLLHPVLDRAHWIVPESVMNDGWWLKAPKEPLKERKPIFPGLACILCALMITNLPRQPIDVAHKNIPVSLPHSLAGFTAVRFPLSAREEAYFTQYGGSAKKAAYGDHNLLLVRSSAPLRHLHAPDECLRGLGMSVEYAGAVYDTIPTAIYKATTQEGQSYRIAVTFMTQDGGFMTTNVSEAVWRWMQNPGQVWTAVQRISPWETSPQKNEAFDRALITALDLRPQEYPITLASTGVEE